MTKKSIIRNFGTEDLSSSVRKRTPGRLKLVALLLLCLSCMTAKAEATSVSSAGETVAQQAGKKISGTVTDVNGEPNGGLSIRIPIPVWRYDSHHYSLTINR
ncbi:MAG: hypothetical protein LBL42_04430 [Tannerella sp.]|nr:hypothetical protein [Tannerella sp.]